MPQYYFDIHDDEVTLDVEGVELRDAPHAILFAYEAARDIAADTVKSGRLGLRHRIDIYDAGGRFVDCVTFGEAVGVEP